MTWIKKKRYGASKVYKIHPIKKLLSYCSKRSKIFFKHSFLKYGMISAIIIGLMGWLAFGFFYNNHDHQSITDKIAQKPPVNSLNEQQPVFNFYQLLPESDLGQIIQNHEKSLKLPLLHNEKVVSQAMQDQKTEVAQSSTSYTIQVASFKNEDDAQNFVAKLLPWDIYAKVVLSNDKRNEHSWYRVLIGPEFALATVNEIRKKLKNHGVDSLVFKEQVN